jgi:cytochrome c biogenesis protein ResB
VGAPTPTGWMDLRFQVDKFLASAVQQEEPHYVHYISSGGGDANYSAAIHAWLERDGKKVPGGDFWLSEGNTRQVAVSGRNVYVNFGKKRITLPFQLKLNRFHIGMDPGTRKAASYESLVTVQQGGQSIGEATKISMNEPLHYGGYTFYQASYSLEEGRPPVSVFSVNYDPGRWIKYLGSLILVLGIALMFYMNPHYWDKIFGRRAPKGGTAA